jgi:ferritin-like metal-binding protein YciE
MAAGTLRNLFEHELHDLRTTEQQILTTLPELITSANSPDLKGALQRHLEQTRIHLERLDLIYKQSGLTAASDGRSGVEGIIQAGSRMVSQQTDADVRDAAIIDAAQHVEHYEIAGYGCARTFARQLNDDHAASLLQQTLDEEGAANKKLTQIAESGINQAASAGADLGRERRPRLRYVEIRDLAVADRYQDAKVRNRAGDDLGRIDGFVFDHTGRPYYLVVDAGGLFVGRRYLVPVGRADFGSGERLFTIDLDKDTLKRYPEFHRESFFAMTDDEARRYEWRVLEAIDPQAARATPSEWDYDRVPYYRQPDWFAGDVVSASAPSRRDTSRSRNVPVSTGAEERERVIAREEAPDREELPGERIRGRSDER